MPIFLRLTKRPTFQKFDLLFQYFIFQFILDDRGELITVQTAEVDVGNSGNEENIFVKKYVNLNDLKCYVHLKI